MSLKRVADDYIANIDKLYNERDKTQSENLARELIRHFVDNEPSPGIEVEKQLVDQFLPMLPVAAFNEVAKTILRPDNHVLSISMPDNGSMQMPSKEDMKTILNDVLNTEYEAYEDKALTEPLIAELPSKGSIVERKELPEFGATELTLSNGAKVLVKTTDFAADEVLINVTARGGKSCLTGIGSANMNMMGIAVESSKLGLYDNTDIEKYLAGKKVQVGFAIGSNSMGLNGQSTVKDLPTAMELIYAYFTELNPDAEMYQTNVNQMKTFLANQMKNPQTIFFQKVFNKWYDGNPAAKQLTLEDVSDANYEEMLGMAQGLLSNARDYTFIFVGNTTVEDLTPMIEQYIATLPSENKKTDYKLMPVKQHKGCIDYSFEQPMESPQTMVFDVISGSNLPENLSTDIQMGLTGDLLNMIYTRTLREDEGGTYGASCDGNYNSFSKEWTLLYFFSTGADKKANLEKRAIDELTKLMTNGADVEDFNKVKSAALAQYEINIKKNSFWRGTLLDYVLLGRNTYSSYEEALNAVTLKKQNDFMNKLYKNANLKNAKKANRVQVIMDGISIEK